MGARNHYVGRCFRCGEACAKQTAFIHKYNGKWVMHHFACCNEAKREGGDPGKYFGKTLPSLATKSGGVLRVRNK